MNSDANAIFRRTFFWFLCDVIQNTSRLCVFHAPEWKMEIITNYIINMLHKLQTINFGDKLHVCVCAAIIVKRPRASVTTYFLCPKTMIIIVYLYLIACTKRFFIFFIFFTLHPILVQSYVVLPPAISPDGIRCIL